MDREEYFEETEDESKYEHRMNYLKPEIDKYFEKGMKKDVKNKSEYYEENTIIKKDLKTDMPGVGPSSNWIRELTWT